MIPPVQASGVCGIGSLAMCLVKNTKEVLKMADDKERKTEQSEITSLIISTPEDMKNISRFIDENIDKGPIRVTFS